MKIIKKLFFFLLLLLLATILVGLGYYLAVTKNVKLDPDKLLFQEQTLTLYDGNGISVHNGFPSSFRQATSIKEIPLHVQRAFVDTEDKRFYSHHGYDVKRIARATFNNAKAKSFKEGASTISQQLIKNTHLSQEKTLKRKLKEWKLTRALEARYAKDEILERYLNTIYFGHGCFGITSASEYYFGKTPNELTLSDGAILAGLVKSPNHYSPFKNAEKCARRKSVVLAAMEKNGSITKKERTTADEQPLPLNPTSKRETGYLSFVFDELTALAEEYSFTVGGKIEIYTYLDEATQKEVERIAANYTESDKTLLVLDKESRGFKACVSTLGNRPRLPGSLIKPLLVYAPAIEENLLSPATPILDEKINYGGYSPENYDGKYHGYVSARECVEKSLNIPAVKILESLTVEKGAAYLKKLGLDVCKADKSLALALGGMKEGYTLKELLSAYASFANGGLIEACRFISSVKINGLPVYQRKSNVKRVFSEETVHLTTDMLKGTAMRGTAKKLRSLPFEIAAKTGTVGTKNGNTDAYALSYTTRDVAAVWLGNADNKEISCTGGGTPCNLLFQINQALFNIYQSRSQEIENFPSCDKVKKVYLDRESYYDTHTMVLADELSPNTARISELFKKSAIPLSKSTSYTNPTISPPKIQLKNGTVVITFDKCPTYYTYRIDRYDYATHTTIYEGEYLASFTDEQLEEGKNYQYTITPIYQNKIGASITLPSITTKSEFVIDEEKVPKEWWKE